MRTFLSPQLSCVRPLPKAAMALPTLVLKALWLDNLTLFRCQRIQLKGKAANN